MKINILSLAIIYIIFAISSSKKNKLTLKLKTHKKQVAFGNLPPTPKGPGQKKVKSIEQLSLDPNLLKVFTVDYAGNYALQTLDKRKLFRIGKFCNRIDSDYDKFCSKLTSCDICGQTSKCGWCESTKQCVSGDTGGPDCPEDCLNGWMFHTKQCKNNVKAGKLAGWAQDATGLKNAEIVDNEGKYVRVNYYEPNYFVKEQKVQIGTQKKKEIDHKVNVKFDKQNIKEEFTRTEPLYGKQVIRVPLINKKLVTKLIDIASGEEIPPPKVTETKKLYGIDAPPKTGDAKPDDNKTDGAKPDPPKTDSARRRRR